MDEEKEIDLLRKQNAEMRKALQIISADTRGEPATMRTAVRTLNSIHTYTNKVIRSVS